MSTVVSNTITNTKSNRACEPTVAEVVDLTTCNKKFLIFKNNTNYSQMINMDNITHIQQLDKYRYRIYLGCREYYVEIDDKGHAEQLLDWINNN